MPATHHYSPAQVSFDPDQQLSLSASHQEAVTHSAEQFAPRDLQPLYLVSTEQAPPRYH